MRKIILIALLGALTVLLLYLYTDSSSTFVVNYNGEETVYTAEGIKSIGSAVMMSGILMGAFLMTLLLFSGVFLSVFFVFFFIAFFFLGRAILLLLPLLLIFAILILIFKKRDKF